MQLISTEVGLSHMHLRDEEEDNQIKALAIYKENRVGRANFAELKFLCPNLMMTKSTTKKHLFRNLKDHLGNMRYSYILY